MEEKSMSKKPLFILSVLVIGMLVFTACAPAAAPAPVEEPVVKEAPAEDAPVEEAKGPDWWEGLGTEENPIIFVAVPSGETERVLSGFDKMAKMIYANTGIVIEPFVATSYVSAIEAFCQDPPKAHMGALATFAYILASSKGCAETALVSVRNGAAYYNGQFVVRADSGLEKLEDLKGKTWCAPSITSTSGYVIPSIMFKAVGIDATTDFAAIVEGGGKHEVALSGLYNGDCDFATSYIDARSRIETEFPDVMEKTTVIEVMPDIPNDGIQFVTDMPVALKGKLVKAILDLFKTEEGKAAMEEAYQWTAMETHGDDFYDQFRQVLDAAGIDPEELAK
jgi:phosphonate transport system substrate-binding protein